MRKIIAISDTHSQHGKLTEDITRLIESPDDILIHAGDVTEHGKREEVIEFLDWFASFDIKHKIFIAGNHDTALGLNPFIAEPYKENGVTYLIDSFIQIDKLKIYGSPWIPKIGNFFFNLERGEAIAQKWANIPDDVVILVTHCPPYGILDKAGILNVGCEDLYMKVAKVQPKIHIFGHLHDNYGYKIIDPTIYMNAANLDSGYNYLYTPTSFYIDFL